jgi:hypothetical protein
MNYLPPLTGQQLEVYLSMPKDSVGHVRCIQSFAEPQREVMERLWREWCKGHDRKWWPDHILQHIRVKGSKR